MVEAISRPPGPEECLRAQGAVLARGRKAVPHLVGYSTVADVGKAAKDWPDLNFIVYHSAYRWVGGVDPKEGRAQWERTGRVEWTNDLADIPAQYGVKNVYGDLGQIFAWTAAAEPRLAAFIMGSLVKGLGQTMWCGEPTRSGPARRNGRSKPFAASRYLRTCRRSTASRRSAAADGAVKNGIFG
jgi:hypothetical protein